MTPEEMNALGTMPLSESRKLAIAVVEKRIVKTIKQKTAKAQVIRDLNSAPNSAEVMRIMWQNHLASEGLRTVGSAWKNKYNNI